MSFWGIDPVSALCDLHSMVILVRLCIVLALVFVQTTTSAHASSCLPTCPQTLCRGDDADTGLFKAEVIAKQAPNSVQVRVTEAFVGSPVVTVNDEFWLTEVHFEVIEVGNDVLLRASESIALTSIFHLQGNQVLCPTFSEGEVAEQVGLTPVVDAWNTASCEEDLTSAGLDNPPCDAGFCSASAKGPSLPLALALLLVCMQLVFVGSRRAALGAKRPIDLG